MKQTAQSLGGNAQEGSGNARRHRTAIAYAAPHKWQGGERRGLEGKPFVLYLFVRGHASPRAGGRKRGKSRNHLAGVEDFMLAEATYERR